MKKATAFTIALFSLLTTFSQSIVNLQENEAHASNGLEYGYYITNETNKEVKGEDYERYEINLYVTNNNACIKLIPFRSGWTGSTSNNDEIQIAEFNCTNATGKRLTQKKGTVNAKPWYTMVRVRDESVKDKYRTVNAQVGYAIRSGQTITNRIIVIVPKGERPKINCRIIYLPELQ
jgi:hypothetical protein